MSDRSVGIVDTHRDLDRSGDIRPRFEAAIREALAKQSEHPLNPSPSDVLKQAISRGSESSLKPERASSDGVFDNLKGGATGTQAPELSAQAIENLDAIKDIHGIERVVKSVAPSEREGYRLAGASENAPGLHTYKSVYADANRPDLIRYTTQAGDKVVVSRELTPELFDQVTRAQEKLKLIADSEASGYRLAEPAEPPTRRFGFKSAESLSLGLIRYETEAGDKVIVSRVFTPDLYAQIAKEAQIFNGASGVLDTALIDDSPYGARAGEWGVFNREDGKFPIQQDIDLNRPRAAANRASAVGAWASMAAAGLGWAAAGVGMIAGMVLPIIQVAQRSDQINDLYNGLIPTLKKYDLTGGPEIEGDFSAEDIYPYQSAT